MARRSRRASRRQSISGTLSGMQRRTMLKALAAMSLAACGRASPRPRRIVVAGAGIVGASIAYHLARGGADVTVIDRQAPASHASRGSFAWINASWAKQPRAYHALNQAGVAGWHTLQNQLDIALRWGGSLEWFERADRASLLVEQIAEQADWGEPARMLDASEAAALEPQLLLPPGSRVAYSGNDGAVDPVQATRALLEGAAAFGARVRYPCELEDVRLASGRLQAVVSSDGDIAADRLVLATGAAADAGARFAACDIPQRSTPGIIVQTAPLPRLLQRVIAAPGIHMHQRDDGRLVLGEQSGAPDTEAHAERLAGRPNEFPDRHIAGQHARRMLAIADRFLPGIGAAEVEQVYIGWRPLPLDGHPVLGASPARPDVYLAITHSGVTLAPVIGMLASRELLTGVSLERLAHYRPGRSFDLVRRY